MRSIEEIHEVPKQEKIDILESVSQTAEIPVIKKTISLLNDPDIEVRGEAFSALVLNKNDISRVLIDSLNDDEKNVRAFTSLILGNRKSAGAAEPLRRLTKDQSAAVRSCALGALGHLKAAGAEKEIRDCFADDDAEVRKSALKAAMDIGYGITKQELESLSRWDDDELRKLAAMAEQKNG